MLDQILSGLKQGLPSSGEQWWQSRLAQAVLSWVEGHGSGISGLVGRFQQKGLGNSSHPGSVPARISPSRRLN